jgi:hypothetical protein
MQAVKVKVRRYEQLILPILLCYQFLLQRHYRQYHPKNKRNHFKVKNVFLIIEGNVYEYTLQMRLQRHWFGVKSNMIGGQDANVVHVYLLYFHVHHECRGHPPYPAIEILLVKNAKYKWPYEGHLEATDRAFGNIDSNGHAGNIFSFTILAL